MSTQNEAHHDVIQEGPFWRVRPRGVETRSAKPSGILEEGRQNPNDVARSSRNTNAQSHSDEEIKRLIRSGQSFTKTAADKYTRKHMGQPYAPLPNSPSSLVKQGPIGRVFALAATDHPEYKKRVFDAYKRRMPKVVADAKDYDDLLARAYGQLGKETKQQFDSLPVNMSFHRNGEGNYSSSKQMLNDIFNNRHLYVFQGGDPHDFLHEVDPKTGLNTNEMFRAIHDFYGHAVHGNQFGPKGEEEAWAAHGAMFSPLARLAMSAETRGQNSFVNYTPINAKLKAEIAKQEEAAYHARRSGNHDAEAQFLQNKKDLLGHFQYAPQKSVLLPPEMISEKYEGGMPGYLKDLIHPQHGIEAELTHFSHEPNLAMTDPRMYGTGIKGAEAARLDDPTAVKHRTYFYEGKPERGEPGLGVHRYGATVSGLYPAENDPEHLRMLALEANRIPITAMANPGMTSGSQAYTDMERLAKEYGYKGVLSRGVSMPTAAVFEPIHVRKMAKGGEVSVTAVKKRKDDKIPELELAAKALLAGAITRAEYDKTVKKLKPVTKYESVPRPATDEEAMGALKVTQKPHWRGTDVFPEGHPVGLRLDIPAYSDHGVWVNSVHDESGAKTPVKYAPVFAVRNAEFDPGPSKAQRVATGETNKSPFARIKGEWQPMTDKEAVAHMQKHLNHPDYVQVGYDPRRRDYFYHRGDTRKPITHAEHVVQIGPLVLAKNPVYGKRKDFGLKDGGPIHLAIGGQGPKNWIKGGVESVVKPLKSKVTTDQITQYAPEQVERLQSTGRLARNDAVNQWIDRNLTNYIKKQMATHDDPIRKLAEQGIVHMPPEQMGYGSTQAEGVRKVHGAPRLGQSPEAQAWEDATDVAMHKVPVSSIPKKAFIGKSSWEPWMEKADPNTQVFHPTDSMHSHYLGFDHLVDILKQDLAEGRLRPDQLSKVSIEHAVRRAHEYDQERKKAMAETALKATEGMPVHKEYPEGYKWIELTLPTVGNEIPPTHQLEPYESKVHGGTGYRVVNKATGMKGEGFKTPERATSEFLKSHAEDKLAEALKYEGDTMGHCVGGYTPDVASGKSRIFSLRDAKNEPHVTVEVKPKSVEEGIRNLPDAERQALAQEVKDQHFGGVMPGVRDEDKYFNLIDQHYVAKHGMPAPVINQIKGKGNAKPKKDYIPYVQDFVKSGNWSHVGDLKNTDLVKHEGKYMTPDEHSDYLLSQLKPDNKAHGGRVTHAHHLEIEERPL